MSFLRRLTGRLDSGERLEAARRRFLAEDFLRAASDAERVVSESAPAANIAVAEAAADLWLEALARAGRGDLRGAAAERCRNFGVRTRDVLGAFAAHGAVVARRADPDALSGYVDALERNAVADPTVQKAIHRVLAQSLYVAIDESPSRFDGRVLLLERLSTVTPDLPFVRVYLGRYAYLRGDFNTAARHLAAVRGSAASSPKVLTLLGRACEKLGRVEEATAAYIASLTANRRQAAVHFRLGRLLLARYVDQPS